MSKFVGWDEEGSDKFGGSGGSSQFLKLQSGQKYKVRLVGKAIKYLQHWEPVICRSPGTDPATGDVVDPLMRLGYEPKPRYAIWVLDREDGNRLKVMDFPGSLFDAFRDWKQIHSEEPGGHKGCDWQIKVIPGPGGDKRKTRYSAMNLDRAPFTEDETSAIKEMGDVSKKLLEFRRDNTPDEIMAMLEEKKKQGNVQKTTEKAGTTAPSAPSAPSASSGGMGKLDF